MSIKVQTMVWDRYPGEDHELLLALKLADFCDDNGEHIFPSIETMAKKCRRSERAVQYQIQSMVERGWLVLVGNATGGRGKACEYRINQDWINGAEIAPIKKGATIAPKRKGAINDRKGATVSVKGATDDTKGCNPLHPNHQEPSENHQETQTGRLTPPVPVENLESEKAENQTDTPKTITAKVLVAEGVDKQHAQDWLTARRSKSLPLTPTAWEDVKAEAAKAGMTPAEAVKCAATAGWAGFKASWLTDGKHAKAPAMSDPEWDRSMEGIKRRGSELNVKEMQVSEQWMVYKARVLKAAGRGPWIDRMLAEYRGTESVYEQLVAYFNDVRADTATA